MYSPGPAPTDQRAGIRPIVFVLDNGQSLESVTLPIRPEDLTRTEGSRATVHQTLGRSVTGWVDNFGQSLPTCTIAGNTGWRHAAGIGRDGFQSFEDLNALVQHKYHEAKQSTIDAGGDPARVKLLFVDVLDHFAWSVVPTQFVLRRSKSRPLLFQYSITLQALSTTIDIPDVQIPNYGNNGVGMTALEAATEVIAEEGGELGMGSEFGGFLDVVTGVFDAVGEALKDISNLGAAYANQLLSLAGDLAQVGLNAFRTVSSLLNLPLDLKAKAARVAAAFNSVACIFQNALRPRKPYEEYSALYGASNCSSTTGGRPASMFAGQAVFDLMQPGSLPFNVTGSALAAIGAIKQADPVLSPLSVSEINRNLFAIVQGVDL
jgi:hypothetical protein